MLKKSLGLVSGAALIAVFAYGCSSSSSDTGTGADSGTGDAKAGDTGTGKETSTVTDGGGGPSCSPGDVSSFAPTWHAPLAFHQKVCTDALVTSIFTCEFDATAAKTTDCQTLLKDTSAAMKACGACLETPVGGSKPGALIVDSNSGLANLDTAGCIANFDSTAATGCAAKYQAARDCATAACADNCPISQDNTDADINALDKCEQTALKADCSKYATDANCADALLNSGGAAEKCDIANYNNDFLQAAIGYGIMFCGGLGDGGTTDAKDAADGG